MNDFFVFICLQAQFLIYLETFLYLNHKLSHFHLSSSLPHPIWQEWASGGVAAVCHVKTQQKQIKFMLQVQSFMTDTFFFFSQIYWCSRLDFLLKKKKSILKFEFKINTWLTSFPVKEDNNNNNNKTDAQHFISVTRKSISCSLFILENWKDFSWKCCSDNIQNVSLSVLL